MNKLKKALDQMGAETWQCFDRLRAEMREQLQAVGKTLDDQQTANAAQQRAMEDLKTSISALQASNTHQGQTLVETSRALLRQQHVLDEGLAQTAEAFDRPRENVGTAVYGYVDDVHTLKTQMRGLSARVEALEKRTSPAV